MIQVEKWDVFETSIMGKAEGNPFTDYTIKGTFKGAKEILTVDGFYDGGGRYLIRFMPSFEGNYTYRIEGSFSEKVITGEFIVTPAVSKHNHGPVRVKDRCYLAYEDGTIYNSIGTTCYAWVHQPEALQEETLRTLEKSCFNKIRFCFFPKFYTFNLEEPMTYPYERGVSVGQQEDSLKKKLYIHVPPKGSKVEDVTDFNCYRFNPEHFQRFDLRIRQLRDMGIEADMIVMHPYDKWGFATMNEECDDLYWNYIIARYGAYRNIWWSLANEYDLFPNKTIEDWERYAAIICEKDPYEHLRSIHNCVQFYDYSRPWITHCSMQRVDFYKSVEYTDEYAEKYKKPIVWDEITYEGNIDWGWGNAAPEELVRKFWEAALRGGYAGHGETYMHPQDILWWSKGGVLHGESPARLAFLLKILEETPGGYLKKAPGLFDEVLAIPVKENREENPYAAFPCSYEIHYYGMGRPSFREFNLPEDEAYDIEVIDTFDMSIEKIGAFSGTTRVNLPGKPYMAVRLIKRN